MQKLLSNAKAVKCDIVFWVTSIGIILPLYTSLPQQRHTFWLIQSFVSEQQSDEEAEPGARRQAGVPAGSVGE